MRENDAIDLYEQECRYRGLSPCAVAKSRQLAMGDVVILHDAAGKVLAIVEVDVNEYWPASARIVVDGNLERRKQEWLRLEVDVDTLFKDAANDNTTGRNRRRLSVTKGRPTSIKT
jgi:hypothetical protein